MRMPEPVELDRVVSEGELFYEFLKFLMTKPHDLIFNVPRGRMDTIDKHKLKFFLDIKGQN